MVYSSGGAAPHTPTRHNAAQLPLKGLYMMLHAQTKRVIHYLTNYDPFDLQYYVVYARRQWYEGDGDTEETAFWRQMGVCAIDDLDPDAGITASGYHYNAATTYNCCKLYRDIQADGVDISDTDALYNAVSARLIDMFADC